MDVLFWTGLPDEIFPGQKSQLGWILEGLEMEDVGLFYGHLIFWMSIWCILR
jgi:hypothetical protein